MALEERTKFYKEWLGCFENASEQTRQTLEMVQVVNADLASVQSLRRRTSSYLTLEEKISIDKQIQVTQDASNSLSFVAQSAGVNSSGTAYITMQDRARFVLRERFDLPSSLARLEVAHGAVHAALNLLQSHRGDGANTSESDFQATLRWRHSMDTISVFSVPAPPYALSLHGQKSPPPSITTGGSPVASSSSSPFEEPLDAGFSTPPENSLRRGALQQSPSPSQQPKNTEMLMRSLITLADPRFQLPTMPGQASAFDDVDKELVVALLRAVGATCASVITKKQLGEDSEVKAARLRMEAARNVLEGYLAVEEEAPVKSQ